MEREIWMPVLGYEGVYEINIRGAIRSLHRRNPNKDLVVRIGRAGYYTVRLSLKGKTNTKHVHRLIAEVFIPNLDCKLHINHINGIKTDNSVTNLEWVTHSENMKHAFATGLIKKLGTPIVDECTGKKYMSIKEAAIDLNINYGTCRNQLNGNIKTSKTCLKYAA